MKGAIVADVSGIRTATQAPGAANLERARADGRRTRVGVRAREGHRAGPELGQAEAAAGIADRSAERQRILKRADPHGAAGQGNRPAPTIVTAHVFQRRGEHKPNDHDAGTAIAAIPIEARISSAAAAATCTVYAVVSILAIASTSSIASPAASKSTGTWGAASGEQFRTATAATRIIHSRASDIA